MARKFATDLDLLGLFSLLNAKLHPVSADPTGLGTGDAGRVWYNTTTNKFMFWNGTAAIDVTSRANHTGTQLASTISDFTTAVQAIRWGSMTAPNADVPMNGFKLTGLADGVAGQDAATYGQVLALINNQVFKTAVRAATTANITLSAPQTIDGVSVVAGDRVLVKNQTTGANNGIYVVAAGAWTRATDADSSTELPPGSIVPVTEGTTQADQLFMLTTNGPITLGTTSLTFLAYGASSGEITVGGNGIIKTGVTLDVVAGSSGTITVGADSVDVNTARVPVKRTGTIPTATGTVDGITVTISGAQVTFTHGQNNPAPMVVIRAGSSPVSGYTAGEIVDMTDATVDANNVRITLPAAPAANNWVFMVVA